MVLNKTAWGWGGMGGFGGGGVVQSGVKYSFLVSDSQGCSGEAKA